MTEKGTWTSAAALLNAIMRGKQYAETAASKRPITWDKGKDLHDSALSCCIFGYLPPPRLTCLRTCTIPSYLGPCMHPDCKEPDVCKGNRLMQATTPDEGMSFVFPHHKTAIGRQHARPIEFVLPPDLTAIIQLYLREGRPKLVSRKAPHPYLFLARSGHYMDSMSGRTKLGPFFQAWIGRFGCTPVAPSLCRHIFIVDRRSNDKVPGPADQDAAVVMGHSTAQWDHGIYDISKFQTAAQNAVDGMAAWRSAHLQQFELHHQQGSKGQTPSQPAHVAHLSSASDSIDVCLSSEEEDEPVRGRKRGCFKRLYQI